MFIFIINWFSNLKGPNPSSSKNRNIISHHGSNSQGGSRSKSTLDPLWGMYTKRFLSGVVQQHLKKLGSLITNCVRLFDTMARTSFMCFLNATSFSLH